MANLSKVPTKYDTPRSKELQRQSAQYLAPRPDGRSETNIQIAPLGNNSSVSGRYNIKKKK